MKIDRSELADIGQPVRLAEEVLSQVGVNDGPIPVEEIAYACDITAIEEVDNAPFVGCLVALPGKSEGTIILRGGQSTPRRRFTIAHELGHFLNPWHMPHAPGQGCVESDIGGQTQRQEMGKAKRREAQANSFAAELLMPKSSFRKRIKDYEPSTQLLAQLQNVFITSKQATAARFVQLSEFPAAAVTTRNGIIKSLSRGGEFPFIGLRNSAAVPAGSVCREFKGAARDHSLAQEIDPCVWAVDLPRGATLFEQVQVQESNYCTSLLWIDSTGVHDDEDLYAQEKSDEEPFFH